MATEADAIVFVAFIWLAIIPTVAAFAVSSGRRILSFVAAGAWLLLGVYSYTNSAATWDIYYALFWLSMGMIVVCVLVPAALKEKKEDNLEPDYGEDKEFMAAIKEEEDDKARFDRLFRGGRRRPRRENGKIEWLGKGR